MNESAAQVTRSVIRKLKDRSFDYYVIIERQEAGFVASMRLYSPTNLEFAVRYHAQFVIPMLVLKDHVDFSIRVLEDALPEHLKPYHPQEPQADPCLHVKNRLR